MNKNYIRSILKSVPDLRLVENYLCEKPSGDFLKGFSVEKKSQGISIWMFILPLYDHVTFIHKTFGESVTNDFAPSEIETSGEAFLRTVSPYREFLSNLNCPSKFLVYLDALEARRNIWGERAYATTLIMQDRPLEALNCLEELLDKDLGSSEAMKNFRRDIECLYSETKIDKAAAKNLLIQWKSESIARLGIFPS